MTVWEILKKHLTGLSEHDHIALEQAKIHLSKEEYKKLHSSVRNEEWKISLHTISVGSINVTYPVVLGKGSESTSAKMKEAAYSTVRESFSHEAFLFFSESIAPGILGLEAVRKAAALQLFADERMHILLLGDPGTGKTEVLESSHQLAKKSSMGLGSGTSGAGLSVTFSGNEEQLGLLPLANGGVCCIDELNLMKKEDRAALYNAMEKGFVTFDKGGRHEKIPADVRVLATANPKGDRFSGEDVEELREQLPFESALLSRFHFIFLVRRPDAEEFAKIAKTIARGKKKKASNLEFLKEYVAYAHTISVKFPSSLEPVITQAAKKIKQHESELLVEVSPRIVKGIIGFAKASARCELRDTVLEMDVRRVLDILSEALDLQL